MLPLRIGIVGCGAAFENLHLNPLRRLQRRGWIKVAALADPNALRQQVAQRRFPEARVAATLSDAMGKNPVELTLITSPPSLHLEHTREAMEAGSHVLCEKPMAESAESARKMAGLARRMDRRLAIGMTRRFYPCLKVAREWIAEGRLGEVRSYHYSEGSLYRWPAASEALFKRATSGGGVLVDKGAHVLDLLNWVFGTARVVGHEDDAWAGAIEGLSRTQLDHSGIAGTLVLSLNQELRNGLLMRGSEGDLYLPVGPLNDLFHRSDTRRWKRVDVRAAYPAELDPQPRTSAPRVYHECIDFQLIQVLRSIRHGEPVPVTAEEALQTMLLIEEAYRLAKPLAQAWLPAVDQSLAIARHWRRAAETNASIVNSRQAASRQHIAQGP